MEQKIKEIKEFYSYNDLMGFYYEWLDDNHYDKPLDRYEVESYLNSQDIEEVIKQAKDLDLNDHDYYEFDGYMNIVNIGDIYDVIDGYALYEPEFVNFVYEEMNEEE